MPVPITTCWDCLSSVAWATAILWMTMKQRQTSRACALLGFLTAWLCIIHQLTLFFLFRNDVNALLPQASHARRLLWEFLSESTFQYRMQVFQWSVLYSSDNCNCARSAQRLQEQRPHRISSMICTTKSKSTPIDEKRNHSCLQCLGGECNKLCQCNSGEEAGCWQCHFKSQACKDCRTVIFFVVLAHNSNYTVIMMEARTQVIVSEIKLHSFASMLLQIHQWKMQHKTFHNSENSQIRLETERRLTTKADLQWSNLVGRRNG